MIVSRRSHLLTGPSSRLMRAAGAAASASARQVSGRQVQQQMQRLVQISSPRPA